MWERCVKRETCSRGAGVTKQPAREVGEELHTHVLQGKKGEHQRPGQDGAYKPVGRTAETHRLDVDVGASFGHQSGHVPAAVFGRPVKSRLSGRRRRVHHKVLLQCSGSVSADSPLQGVTQRLLDRWRDGFLPSCSLITKQHSTVPTAGGGGGQPLVTGGRLMMLV